MASSEDFQTGICNAGGWWNPPGRSHFQPYSAPLSDFMWSTSSTLNEMDEADEMKQAAAAASYSKSDDSDDHHSSSAEPLPVLSSEYAHMADYGGVSDWNQTSLMQDLSTMSIFKPVDEHKNNNSQSFYNLDLSETATKVSQMSLQNSCASSYAYTALLQTLIGPDADMSYVSDDNNFASATSLIHQPTANSPAADWHKLASLSPKQQHNDAARLWNSFMGSSSDEIGKSPESHQLLVPALFEDQKPYSCRNSSFNSRNSSNAPNVDHVKNMAKKSVDSTLLGTKRKNTSEELYKRPRIETPSPLPTFKVRKEKLGDRITALQQLVSPFGKTDTASVLHEAIEYIKFLHDQVSVLRTPYVQNGAPTNQHQQMQNYSKNTAEAPKQDLRSRGLCLVPISSTFPVANETTADFWTPTFGGAMGFR